MKLDKRACRHAANVPLHISLNAGVLYTDRMKYLVTAAVKLLGGHRVLTVCFYECERLKANDRMPKWVVFQGKDDFATLERDAEGNVKWRDAMLMSFADEGFYKFRESCVFYKGTDGAAIADFIHRNVSGIAVLKELQNYQYGIRNKQAKARRCKRDVDIVEKMKKVPAAPSNLAHWIDRNVMPHYLFYVYDRNQPETQVFCTYCEKFSVIKKPKTGKIFVCPQCKQKALAKAQGRRAAYNEDRESCQVIQKISNEELLIRIFKARWAYNVKTNVPQKEIHESARLFIRSVGQESTDTDAYYYDSGYDSATHWRRGNRPRFSPYTSSYEADDTGAVYLPSLKRALQGTPWQYCALRQFYEPTKETMQVSTYLRVYRRYPKLIEHLVKVGFEHIVADIVYRHGMGPEIDDMQERTHRILRVNKEDLTMLRELNAGIDTLRAYQQYTKLNLRGRQELLLWQIKNHVHTIPTQWFSYMTVRKFICYMDSQLPDYMQMKRDFRYRSPMEEAISTYSDYLQMCQEQNYGMKSSQVLFPKHCNETHDELSRYIKKCRDEQTKRAFREVYENLAEKANLTSKKLQIVCPKQTDDLIAEGQALHHCVGTYIERVAAKECLIVFVRRVEEPKKPYVTVEVRNGKIEQIHGDHNSDPTEEVKKFVDLWSRKVLPMALQAA